MSRCEGAVGCSRPVLGQQAREREWGGSRRGEWLDCVAPRVRRRRRRRTALGSPPGLLTVHDPRWLDELRFARELSWTEAGMSVSREARRVCAEREAA